MSNKSYEENILNSINIAIKYQNRMKIPKYFFISVGIVGLIGALQKIFTGQIFMNNDLYYLIYTIYWAFGGLLSIIYILIAGICPYCHQFQINNGKSHSISDNGITYTKGISPFIDYCVHCNAPLSKKAVMKQYNKKS
ncbi:hypothetical protein LNQ82_05275 [Conchiformibius steedae DSM 2580]|uniref:Uncharacterized protein n=1 Tax=Conchiformibius steedae DSM 2580 TaxID=1121352 RepID=A0AAE9HUL7_9NEIS|nr:hypothetical protein [Conchiformibius steedae]QMT32632.1 hypothetical protein H3L98_02355 [Conchiformibius steedae]URD66662.1 hypothetical protein LNQ82_05275 [Conchiformibius steedae DSM 2580]